MGARRTRATLLALPSVPALHRPRQRHSIVVIDRTCHIMMLPVQTVSHLAARECIKGAVLLQTPDTPAGAEHLTHAALLCSTIFGGRIGGAPAQAPLQQACPNARPHFALSHTFLVAVRCAKAASQILRGRPRRTLPFTPQLPPQGVPTTAQRVSRRCVRCRAQTWLASCSRG